MKLSLEQFELAMNKQKDKSISLSYDGSFNHSNVYEKFLLECNSLEYSFKDLIFDNPDLEMTTNSVLRRDIKEITYLWFSNQIELVLRDGNRLVIDLMVEFDLNEYYKKGG